MKKNRIYLTSKSYLKKVRQACLVLLLIGALASLVTLFFMGLTFVSLGIAVGIVAFSFFAMRYVWNNSCSLSLKHDNLLIKCMREKNIVAPVGSIREVKTSDFLGYKLTKLCYHLDGMRSTFFIVTKSRIETPEMLIKKSITVSRKRKKEANHKPDSVLTQIA